MNDSPTSSAAGKPVSFCKLITQPAFLDLLGVGVIGLIGDARTRGRDAVQFLIARRQRRSGEK